MRLTDYWQSVFNKTITKQVLNKVSQWLTSNLPQPIATLPTQAKVVLSLPYLTPQEEIETIASGLKTKGYRSIVPNAQRNILFALGHGTSYKSYQKFMTDLNQRGFNVVIIELPQDQHDPSRIISERYDDVIADTVFNKYSAFYRYLPSNIPFSLLTHSSSGRSYEQLIEKSAEFVEFENEFFQGRVVHEAPMIDTAGSSVLHHPWCSWLYNQYAQLKLIEDKVIGTAALDRVQQSVKAIKKEPWLSLCRAWHGKPLYQVDPHYPTHPQAKKLKDAGIRLFKQVQNRVLNSAYNTNRLFRPSFIVSRTDNATDHLTTEDFAKLLGAECRTLTRGGHTPLLSSHDTARQEAFSYIIDKLTGESKNLTPQQNQTTQVQHTPLVSVDMRLEA